MNSREILRLSLKKSWRGYEAFLILIAALEAMMMLYFPHYSGFRGMRSRMYFTSYIFLFCCSIIAMIINRSCMKQGKHESLAMLNVHAYCVVLIHWSAVLSALDLIGGGYSVTYMTILAAVGSVIALPPLVFILLAATSSCAMIAIALAWETSRLDIPFYLNLVIFLLVVILVEFRNHRSTREQYMLEKRLKDLASVDSLTQVANRRALDKYIARLLREHSQFTFALLDVDNFKAVNDTYGHLEGDLSLMYIANILTEFFGERVFRYGGDEFAVISFEDAGRIAEKMERINLRLKENDTEYVLQICSGVYQSADQDDGRRIYELADSALYEAKRMGKARSVIYREPMTEAGTDSPSHPGT